MTDLIPKSFQRLNDIIIIKPNKNEKKIADEILKEFPKVRMVCSIRYISGELRQPKLKIIKSRLSGDKNTEVIVNENKTKYKLDVARVMFSKGNLFERNRLVDEVKQTETIIDMFAGIGYFSLPLSKKVDKIYSIEKNYVSFYYLNENIILNKINNIEPICGDNTDKHIVKRLENKADRVLMGYFSKHNNTKRFLATAFRYLKKSGIIHYHNVYSKDELWTKVEYDIIQEAMKSGYSIKIINKKIVKSVAPNMYHIVVDFQAKQ